MYRASLAGLILGSAVALPPVATQAIGFDDEQALLLAELDINNVMELKQSGEILPLESILGRVRELQPGRVIEIELEDDDGRYIYEMEVVDDSGVVWDIDVDARTGELLERERDD
ncbi:putative membrane protein YkoI [Methylohalomonas lacus]|uniref:Membrane protein YkoI n=1 Tax=Methylohalomonas lacus TaxID=398773 RepID=A0AAE3HN99_9GAMM|nr:PepSY domain-containing protein [Methylohalomonas lacus]MCS3904578.1 putative membrane protein YkoI [Methylohalomonas lacus]